MLLEWWSGTECTLYTDQATVDKFGKEHVIIILNHNYEIDFLCGWTMCERYGILGVSNAAKHVPYYNDAQLCFNTLSTLEFSQSENHASVLSL